MAELLLVSNPRKRKRKMTAKQKKYFGKKRKAHRRRKVAPVAAAPRRRRRKARTHKRPANARREVGYAVGNAPIRRRKLNPHRRHHARRHRNPSLRNITGQLMPTVKAGAWGAAGALGLDVLWGLVVGNLPSIATYIANPYVGFAAKAAGAVVVGSVGGHLAKGKGRELAVGAMTVVTHDFLKTLLQGMAPTIFGVGGSLPLGAYLSGAGSPAGLGAYLSGSAPIVGTATIPQAYLPFAGSSGASGSDGVYAEDHMGMDPWNP
ncbi:MAG: hypothetical protein ACRETL_06985 [Gammaproteobacteria bacterium]